MKLSKDLLTHTTRGEHYVISTGDSRFKGLIKSNETAAFIVECLKTDTTEDEITDKLLTKYSGADRQTVLGDVKSIIAKLRSIGALEE